ncbi:unnamed protein product [Hydatigera taeniaeformis]|uniref:Nucleoporin NUP35 n=1 Tax=Hydatigena taeniaeformis TaxID=6205 RepID=A0A3P7G5J7_HYDTA|nr:unnamed protein product [Hydatigera taeniaeformis]
MLLMLGVSLSSPKCSAQSSGRSSKNLEPMSMGSPSASPLNSSSPKYLPGFLMGEFQASPSNGYQVSPIFKPHPPQHTRIVQPRLSGLKPPPSVERSVRRHASPPTQSLWSSASQKRVSDLGINQSAVESIPKDSTITPNQPVVTHSKVDGSGFSPLFHSLTQISSSDRSLKEGYLATPDDETATWITVFGYDPAQANFILQHFAHLGTIEKYIIANGGNWMNIKYANKIQARCALNKNGRVLAGKFMIGVRRCNDLNALNSSEAVIPGASDFLSDVEPTDVVENSVSESHVQGLLNSPAARLESPLRRDGSRIVATTEVSGSFKRSLASGHTCLGPVRSAAALSRHSSMRPLAAPYQPPPRVHVTRANQNQSFRFSDYLIMTEPETVTTGHYLVKSELTIVSMILEEPKLEDDIPVERCIRVRAVECVVELMFADADDKLSWYKSLEDTIKQERHRNDLMLNAVSRRQSNVTPSKEGETPRAAEWVKDEQATMCALCYRHFTHIRRKHHCRACGKVDDLPYIAPRKRRGPAGLDFGDGTCSDSSYIFCGACSNYRAKVDHQGPVEVRVCEVDFYRLNPNLKPKNAAALERIAQFSESGQRYAPYHCGFLMFTKKIRDSWPHKKTHVRMEYSAGLVSRETSPSRPPPLTPSTSCSLSGNSSPSLFLSIPSREMSLDFANLGDASSSVANVATNSSLSSSSPPLPSSAIVPLPAARLIVRPQTSRVFCVLQSDTLMSVYAAKEDARSCDGIILLGTRLVYLVRVSGEGATNHGNTSTTSTPSPPSGRQRFGSQISSETSNRNSVDSKSIASTPAEGNRLSEVERSPVRKALSEVRDSSFYTRVCGQKTPLAMLHLSNSEEGGGEDEVPLSVTEDDNHKFNGLPISKAVSPIAVDTLSVLSSMNGFLILPNNTDKVGHYFEAPNEEVRNTLTKQPSAGVYDLAGGRHGIDVCFFDEFWDPN